MHIVHCCGFMLLQTIHKKEAFIILVPVTLDPRSTNYGTSFTKINNQLDPTSRNLLLWPGFHVSPINKNMVCSPVPMRVALR